MAKMFYKIGEVSKLAEVDVPTLRYWEKEFPLLKPQKTRSGQRIYRQEDLEMILRIKHLLYEEEYTVSGARKKLSGLTSEPPGTLRPTKNGQRANRLQRARQLAREILEILNTQNIS
nr:MerR family transcriptional regulator [Bacillota bacterium]